MIKREIGKYLITLYENELIADIRCGKAHIIINLNVGSNHRLKTTTQEKDVAHILKMERIELKKNLAKLEELL